MLSTPPVTQISHHLSNPIPGEKRAARITLALMILAGLIGMGILAYSTTWGPAVEGDAAVYIESARNLLAGRGLGWYGPQGNFHLLPLSPPFYPLVLAGLGWLGFDLVEAARWINIALFGATILLSGLSIHHFTRSTGLAVGMSLLVLVSPVMVDIHMWAMAEPLFTFAGLLALVLLLLSFERSRSGFWIFSAVLSGLAFLTRYAGVAFVGAGILACGLLAHGSWKRRLRMACIYGLIGCLPVAIWGIYDVAITGAVGSRQVQPLDTLWARFLEMRQPVLETVISWVPFSTTLTSRIDPPLSGMLWAALGLLVVGALGWIYWKLKQEHRRQWLETPGARPLVLFFIFLIAYAAVIVLSYLFVFPPPHLSDRILSPLHWGGMFLLVSMIFLLASNGPRWIIVVSGGILLVSLIYYGQHSRLAAMTYHRDGLGYSGAYWQSSDLIAAARRIPATTPLVTNELTAILFLLHRPAYVVQEIYNQKPSDSFTAYGDEPGDEAQRVFRTERAALLLFNSIYDDFSEIYGERAEERIERLTDGLYLDYQGRDGNIFYYTPPGP